MSITVVGLWDLAWFAPINEVDLWQFVLNEYAVESWYMSPISGISSGVPILVEKPQMEICIENARADGKTIVFCDESASSAISDFAHPIDACYVLGRAGFSPYISFYNPDSGDVALKIPTVSNLGGFWPHQAISIILHDRFVKSFGNA